VLAASALVAADKSGVSPNTISVPKGPGSIEGLGEAFQPTLNTGTAKYNIKLATTPGTAGQTPPLALVYEGGSANGPLGFGWSMPASYVQRQTDKGIPRYGQTIGGVSDPDVFINEMREELVPVTDGAVVSFFCKNEGAFIRYRRVGDYWEATAPDGSRLTFGQTPQARIVDPSDPQRIFRWLLERESDTRGNTIDYSYVAFPGPSNLNQKYCSEIRYGPGAGPWTAFHFVQFEYEAREDWFEDGRAGFLIRTGVRLKGLVLGSQGVSLAGHVTGDFNGDGTGDVLNRRYRLSYRPGSSWSLLARVTLLGADGVTASHSL
jgi:hypothetical protein